MPELDAPPAGTIAVDVEGLDAPPTGTVPVPEYTVPSPPKVQPTALKSLAARSQRVFGFDPNIQRGNILPLGRTPEGEMTLATPQFMVDILNSALLPGHVAQGGEYTEQDVTRAALDVAPGARLLGMRKPPPTRGQVIRDAPTRQQIKAESQRLYKDVESKGIVVPGTDAMELVDNLSDSLRKEGVDEVLHPKAVGILKKWQEKTREPAAGSNAPRDLPLEELEIMRRQAGIVAKSTDPDEQRIGSKMKEAIDDYVDGIPDAAGLKQARELWRRNAKLQDIEEIFFKAENQASGFENGLRTGFRSLLQNPRRRKNFSKAEIRAMQNVVNGGPVRGFLRMMSHFGPPADGGNRFLGSVIGAGAGGTVGTHMGGPEAGFMGAAALPALGHGAGHLARRSTEDAGRFVQALTASGSSVPDVDTLTRMLLRQVPRRLPGPLIGTGLEDQ